MVEWTTFPDLAPYAETVSAMEARVAAIRNGDAREAVWLIEHPPLYTAGTSARREDLIDPGGLPVFETGRGGQYTYHGPGQRIVYVMLDLERQERDLRGFITRLEAWVIAALADCGVIGVTRPDRVGVWVERPDLPRLPDGGMRDDKIAAIGIRLRRWVSFHGIAINVSPDLDAYRGIVPCGIATHGVTSLHALGQPASMADLDAALRRRFAGNFRI